MMISAFSLLAANAITMVIAKRRWGENVSRFYMAYLEQSIIYIGNRDKNKIYDKYDIPTKTRDKIDGYILISRIHDVSIMIAALYFSNKYG